jgi:RimJ/RimL family protein N-acetyltransferase
MATDVTESWWRRARTRLRYGTFLQEASDRVARLGLQITPYYVVEEAPLDRPELDELDADLDVRFLGHSEVDLVAAFPARPRAPERVRALLEEARCLGIFVSGQLAGYTWARFDAIPRLRSDQTLYRLQPNEAYLFDAFIDRAHRGRRLAPLMRHHMHKALAAEGYRRFYSITVRLNTASRRFKARLGATELELRVLFAIARRWSSEFRIRKLVPEAWLFASGREDPAGTGG